MIKTKWRLKNGTSTIEYVALVLFILGALIVFDRYILRAFWGQWRRAGETFGQGKQYDPREFGDDGKGGGTLRCSFIYRDSNHRDCDQSGICVKIAGEHGFDECIATKTAELQAASPLTLIAKADVLKLYTVYCNSVSLEEIYDGDWVLQPCYFDCLNSGGNETSCFNKCGPDGEPLVNQYCVDSGYFD